MSRQDRNREWPLPDPSGPSSNSLTRRELTRRAALLGLSLPATSTLLAACGGSDTNETAADNGTAAKASGTVTFVSYGGSYNENLRKSILDPFERQSDIKVKLGENTSLAPLKLQVQSGNVQWDIAELTGSEYEVAVKQDLLEPFDYGVIDIAGVPPYAKKEFGIKYALFLFVMAWDQRVVSDAKGPKTWAEFWDPQAFPGKRSLYDKIDSAGILEAALMAEGVPFDDIYPLDVERALKSLDALGTDNIVWHATPEEAIQQLTSGALPLATSWNGRVGIARRDEGAEIGFTPNQAVLLGDYLVVPKGAPNAKLAFEVINFIVTDAKAGAEYAKLTNYAIANQAAIDLLPPEMAERLPTSPALEGKILVKDDAWWAANLESTSETFKQWQLSG